MSKEETLPEEMNNLAEIKLVYISCLCSKIHV